MIVKDGNKSYLVANRIPPLKKEQTVSIAGAVIANIDPQLPFNVKLLERTVIQQGTAPDSGKIGLNNGKQSINIAVGETASFRSGGRNFLFCWQNQYNTAASTGYIIKIIFELQQGELYKLMEEMN